MGIPSYFIHIVKNHPNIIKQFKESDIIIDNLYIDSNSVIYDAIHAIEYKNNDDDFENKIIKWACKKLLYYINLLKPTKKVIIAFDGVAPVAKLEQQRNRRYKTWFVNNYLSQNNKEKKEVWDTSTITPGSKFMKKLCEDIKSFFNNHKNLEIIVSGSEEQGEGEHKIFQYIRNNEKYHYNTNTIIYGLDADLIMLTLIHLKICINLYLFRETPHFISSINSNLIPDETYVLDIYELGCKLNENMCGDPQKNCINDYIFLCFFLGNDFLPHFPALNIRTHGIQIIMDAYQETIAKKGRIITNNKISWKWVRALINSIAPNEEQYCMEEMKQKSKLHKNFKNNRNRKYSQEEELMSTPILDRTVENYINIGDIGWEKRYYKELFDIDIDDVREKQICTNYLEGLEWNYKYYTTDCPDWMWHYKYKYPPLLKDLVKYIPEFDITFIEEKPQYTLDPLVQLAYVLPRNSLHLLPHNLYEKLIIEQEKWYKLDYKIIWAFCRYLWEGHVVLPHINISVLEKLVKDSI